MPQFLTRIIALKPYQTEIIRRLQTQPEVHLRMKRWGHQIDTFLSEITHTLRERYQLNDTFARLYRLFLHEILLNAQKESDFVFLFKREILKMAPGFNLAKDNDGTYQKLLDSMLNTRRLEFMPLAIEFQLKQVKFYQWLEAQTQIKRVRDIPQIYRDTYPLIRERRAHREFDTSISFLLEPNSLGVAVVNQSYLDKTQINRIMGKMMRTHLEPTANIENDIDVSHGGAGLGGEMIHHMLYNPENFGMDANHLPFVIIPDQKNHHVSITLTLEAEALAKLKIH